MLGEYFEFVGLMVSLLLRGLFDTGEYFVVGVDSRQYNPKTPRIYLEGRPTPFGHKGPVIDYRDSEGGGLQNGKIAGSRQ